MFSDFLTRFLTQSVRNVSIGSATAEYIMTAKRLFPKALRHANPKISVNKSTAKLQNVISHNLSYAFRMVCLTL